MIKMCEVFYGWKAGSYEVDEKGNTRIFVNCENVETVLDEIDLLISTEKVAKRGKLSLLTFAIGDKHYTLGDNISKNCDKSVLVIDGDYSVENMRYFSDTVSCLEYLFEILKNSYLTDKTV